MSQPRAVGARQHVKRMIDLLFACAMAALLAVPALVLAIIVRLSSPGPALYWSDRIGRDNAVFRMPKFRTMRVDTPPIATHLMLDPDVYLTPAGSFLRRTSLDEIPQLWSVLRGDMSFVGPRPALFNQSDLIELRTAAGVHHLTPGLTGWAQISGRDSLPIRHKVDLDAEYGRRQSLLFDCRILLATVGRVLRSEHVSH